MTTPSFEAGYKQFLEADAQHLADVGRSGPAVTTRWDASAQELDLVVDGTSTCRIAALGHFAPLGNGYPDVPRAGHEACRKSNMRGKWLRGAPSGYLSKGGSSDEFSQSGSHGCWW